MVLTASPSIRKNMKNLPALSLGFTLVELMITVSILAILAAAAIPSFQGMLRTSHLVSLTNELAGALNLARSEAIKRGKRVTVCQSAAPQVTNPDCSISPPSTWETGWLIFVDESTVGTFDGSDIRLKVGQLATSNAVITPTTGFADYISYLPNGASNTIGNIAICIENVQRSLVISRTGRIRIEKDTC
jgi:type IV fimbrial biogenesis protein FimT